MPAKRKNTTAASGHRRKKRRVLASTSVAPSGTRVSASALSAPPASSDLSGANGLSSVQIVMLSEAHMKAIAQTKKHGKSTACIKNARNRVAEMIEWVLIKYPEYVNRGTVVVTNA